MEFFDGLVGVFDGDVSAVVDGGVAESFDEFGFVEESLGDEVAEAGFVDEGAEGIVVGLAQALVEAVEPVDDGFQGEAGVEAGSARVAEDVAFGFGCGFGDDAKLAGEEGEIGHEIDNRAIATYEFIVYL